MGAVAKALGEAYSEPAKDVEGYIAYVKGQKRQLACWDKELHDPFASSTREVTDKKPGTPRY
jgi:hypothetical protein